MRADSTKPETEAREILTAEDVADLLHTHIITVYRLAASGELPAFKVGRQWRFRREAVDTWCQAKEQVGRSSVLVVDDEPAILKLFADYLRFAGVAGTFVENGYEAIQACQARHFSAVFLDLRMPGLDGVQVMRRIKSLQPDARIIVITAYIDHPLAQQAAALDPMMIMQKPFNADELMAVLQPLATAPA
ncbi:MAG: response regulator [Armatimonadota bacterium]|jgi:two-component system response regulator (stage 0 sporulation protein F)